MVVTTIAVTGAGANPVGMKFAQTGHLIYNSTLGTVFRIDGATKNVDAQVKVPSAGPGTTVVQTDKSGFILAQGRTIEFGKSDLQVADPLPAPATERPVVMEAAGAAFAVYQRAGAVQRLGENPATETLGGALGQSVVTSTGTLWVHRLSTQELCQLPLRAERIACVAKVTAGHTGALALVDDQPVFVDTTVRELRAVNGDGLGRAMSFAQLDIPADAIVAAHDVAGRIAILDRSKNVLQLVDTSQVVSGRPSAEPVVKRLRPGKYEQIASSGDGVALIDATDDSLVTLDRDGEPKTRQKIPPPSKDAKTAKDERPSLFRGGDSRLYVDSKAGEHSMVVEGNGEVTEVEVAGRGDEKDENKTTPSAKPSQSIKPSQPVKPSTPTKTVQPTEEERRETPTPANPPKTKRSDPEREKPETNKPKPRNTPRKPAVQAGRPGAPGDVSATPGDGSALIKWTTAAPNGTPITSYVVSWSGGSRTVEDSDRSLNVTGLTNGSSYVFTVLAENRAGRGAGVSSARITLGGAADAPVGLTTTDWPEEVMLSWRQPDLNGGRLLRYEVTQGGVNESTTAASYRWSGLSTGSQYTFQVRAVTRSADGRVLVGSNASIAATPGSGADGTIQISHGRSGDYTDSNCPEGTSGCAFILLNARNLAPNTTYMFRAYASEWGELHDGGFELETDADGNLTMHKFHNSAVGQQVWVTVDGPGGHFESNRVLWPDE
ncbi:fibronectin type III domain-containing protein [Kribbella caucasensis]|nr:fibronectin type III domain-containing protein [Kribbella sp. VKM Ac-2527]